MLPHEVLCKSIGKHRTRRRSMNDVRSAVCLAQPVIGRARIEKNSVLLSGICRFEKAVRAYVYYDQ